MGGGGGVICTLLLQTFYFHIFYFKTYPKGQNLMMKSLVKCWSEGHDSIRVAALLCLVKMGRIVPSCKEPVLKKVKKNYFYGCIDYGEYIINP